MIYHDPDRALHFVAGILGLPAKDFGKCNGLIVGDEEVIAAVIYHDWHIFEHGSTIQASIASISRKWATRGILRVMFSYPFEDIGVDCMRVCCRRSNKNARDFVQRLKFKYEGMARMEWDGQEDVASYSMTKDEAIRFGWIDGQEHTKRAAAA